jgi:hypothetical protein
MIKLTDILNEIKPVKDEIKVNTDKLYPISDSRYSMYWIDYGGKNDKDKGKYPDYSRTIPVMGGWLKVTEFISKYNLKDYTVYGKKFNANTHENELDIIRIVENGVLLKSIPKK